MISSLSSGSMLSVISSTSSSAASALSRNAVATSSGKDAVAQLAGGHVDVHLECPVGEGALPLRGLSARGPQHPRPERHD